MLRQEALRFQIKWQGNKKDVSRNFQDYKTIFLQVFSGLQARSAWSMRECLGCKEEVSGLQGRGARSRECRQGCKGIASREVLPGLQG